MILTDADLRAKRAARFGVDVAEDALAKRAKRFGIDTIEDRPLHPRNVKKSKHTEEDTETKSHEKSVHPETLKLMSEEALRRRAERFGVNVIEDVRFETIKCTIYRLLILWDNSYRFFISKFSSFSFLFFFSQSFSQLKKTEEESKAKSKQAKSEKTSTQAPKNTKQSKLSKTAKTTDETKKNSGKQQKNPSNNIDSKEKSANTADSILLIDPKEAERRAARAARFGGAQ